MGTGRECAYWSSVFNAQKGCWAHERMCVWISNIMCWEQLSAHRQTGHGCPLLGTLCHFLFWMRCYYFQGSNLMQFSWKNISLLRIFLYRQPCKWLNGVLEETPVCWFSSMFGSSLVWCQCLLAPSNSACEKEAWPPECAELRGKEQGSSPNC